MQYELILHNYFRTKERTQTSIEALANIWQCSTRYAKTIVQRLQKQQIISWETSRGRGKKPYITLQRTKLETIYDSFHSYWQREQYEQAYTLLADYQLLNNPITQSWLQHHYGVQQSKNEEYIFRYPSYDVNLNLDPIKALSRHDAHFIKQIHETLFKFNEHTKKVEPNLIFHYETKDYKKWRFILRKGILFHNLQPLTTSDIKHSLEQLTDLVAPYFQFLHIEIIHDHEIVITLSTPFALLPNLLSSFRTVILPQDYTDGTIGCGAFMLAENSEKRLQLKTFEHYFHTRPWIDGVDIIYTNHVTDFGISYKPYPNSVPQTEITFQEFGAEYIVLNCHNGPLKNCAMRETIYHLIKPNEFVLKEYNETVATSWVPNQEKITNVSSTLKVPATNFPTLKIGYQQIREGANHLREAHIIQKQLEQYGIASSLECVNLQSETKQVDYSIDIFVGGVAVGRQQVLSILNIYLSHPSPFLSLLNRDNKQWLRGQLQMIYTTSDTIQIEKNFTEIEHRLQTIHCLKFLTHRQHCQYIRKDFPFRQVQFDENGRIDYKKVF